MVQPDNLPDERLAFSVAEAALATGLGRTTIYALFKDGHLRSRKIGGRRLIPAAELRKLMECY